jgi:hypothetical protein
MKDSVCAWECQDGVGFVQILALGWHFFSSLGEIIFEKYPTSHKTRLIGQIRDHQGRGRARRAVRLHVLASYGAALFNLFATSGPLGWILAIPVQSDTFQIFR